MKRTEKKLKSKGIKAHKPSSARAYWCYKYDRNYVAKCEEEITHLPFSRGSKRSGWMLWYEHPNVFLYCYLSTFFRKRIGKNVDEVFREFTHLGWKHSYDMYFYWNDYMSPHRRYSLYFIDDNGNLACNSSENGYSKINLDIDDDKVEKPKAVRRHASDKRLTRKHLDFNESIITNKIEGGGYGNARPGELGEMYVELNHKVVKRKVYLVKTPQNPRIYSPIKLLGLYKEERRYYHKSVITRIETTFNKKELMLEANIIQDMSNSGELIPCI